nr:3932_t:CDS:2 [Entrophospora candida]
MSRLDYFAEKATWSLIGFLEWCLVNPKGQEFGNKDEIHLTYKINLEDIKNKPELLLLRDSVSVKMLAVEALEKFQEETKSDAVKTFWDNYPTLINTLKKAIHLNSIRMVSRVSELHDDLSNTIYTETQDLLFSYLKRKKSDSLQNDVKKLCLDKSKSSGIMKQMENTLKEHSNIDEDAPGNIIKVENENEKISIKKKIFLELRSRHIYPLCKPFKKLSEEDAEELFYEIDSNTTIEFDLPKNIKEYLQDLLSGNIENALFKIEKPLSDTSQLLSWIREVCRHFLLYYYHGGLQTNGSEKTWSTQTIYHILDLFSVFFGKTISGIAFGEVMNEVHNDRAYNINHTQKPSNSGCTSKNDAVLYQDEIPAVLYEQSFGPTEFVLKHQLEDFAKLAHNGVDDLNFHFKQNGNCTTTTAKKFKSIGIHGYKYLVSVYLTDIIRIGTYRIYEVFSCKIPTSYSERWQLVNIAKLGALLEELLIERQNIKEEMSKESILNDSNTDCVYNWIKIPNNTPKSKTINK